MKAVALRTVKTRAPVMTVFLLWLIRTVVVVEVVVLVVIRIVVGIIVVG